MREAIAIIGAGLAGAAAARDLASAGHRVTVFEKSGGTGGRLATRRSVVGAFDHGAQYITARSADFKSCLKMLRGNDAVGLWPKAVDGGKDDWHVGLPGMSGLVKPLLADVEVLNKQTVNAIESNGSSIRVSTDEGLTDDFNRVIVTTPAPQALRLLADVDPAFSVLADIVYAPCWATMVCFAERLENVPDVWRGDDESSLAWSARETAKRREEGAERFVLHAGGAWSASNLEDDHKVIEAKMLAAFSDQFSLDVHPTHTDVHRWRYARVDRALERPFLTGVNGRIVVCGDGMLGGRAEAAFESGRAAAAFLVEI